ncbi:hypothetical protein JMJ77_0004943 [Colletotrichum scovillei]|uniref:Uncharacterized protein n=1 Tax=Colletotrichum scovillei TaxID=1209932 RepID=A0A9P7RG91_9PEZI|nr:hypothetical protein JMJ77_0004943 [Colletotrichum scovillei]KAG7076154.1 hypothetical protein JMJ76_0013422 [Colletotrichum scovillei]KAG7083322.1 hypothetical protein JMJ78_0008768 [Colletotrichum scovillei]
MRRFRCSGDVAKEATDDIFVLHRIHAPRLPYK